MAKGRNIDPSMFIGAEEEIKNVVKKTNEKSSESLDLVVGELSRAMTKLTELSEAIVKKDNSQTVNVSFDELKSSLKSIAESIAETKNAQGFSLTEVSAIFDKLKSNDYTITLESIAKALQERNTMEYELDVKKYTKNDIIKTIHIKPIPKE